MSPQNLDPQPRTILTGLLQGDAVVQRRSMAKAITLLESTRADHRTWADDLLTAMLPHTGRAFRLGLSGVPGVGKSTFIEALGLFLIDQGLRVAVLAIDPSSSVSGGSILGDKTRMEHLSVHPSAFIRPSPSSGNLGGVAEKTRECILVCEAAGYDVVIVETVGVGQSETAVAGMTDLFALMQLPNAGLMTLQDSESSEQLLIDTANPKFRKRYAKLVEERELQLQTTFAQSGVDALEISTNEDIAAALLRFSELRKRRLWRA